MAVEEQTLSAQWQTGRQWADVARISDQGMTLAAIPPSCHHTHAAHCSTSCYPAHLARQPSGPLNKCAAAGMFCQCCMLTLRYPPLRIQRLHPMPSQPGLQLPLARPFLAHVLRRAVAPVREFFVCLTCVQVADRPCSSSQLFFCAESVSIVVERTWAPLVSCSTRVRRM
jgi:hypothetical protein